MTSLLQQRHRMLLFRCLFIILAVVSGLNGENTHVHRHVDCRTTVDDLNYNGNINTTRNGHHCAYWKDRHYSTEEMNFCRTPAGDRDNAGGPWCYINSNGAVCPDLTVNNLMTLDNKTRYKYVESVVLSCKYGNTIIGNKYLTCLQSGQWNDSIPVCGDVSENIYDVTCYNKYDKGVGYTGVVNSTANGQPCKSWKIINSPYTPYYPGHNYCRNRRTDAFNQPWCYTGQNYTTGLCNIPV